MFVLEDSNQVMKMCLFFQGKRKSRSHPLKKKGFGDVLDLDAVMAVIAEIFDG